MIRFWCICVIEANFVDQNGAKTGIRTNCIVLAFYNKFKNSRFSIGITYAGFLLMYRLCFALAILCKANQNEAFLYAIDH